MELGSPRAADAAVRGEFTLIEMMVVLIITGILAIKAQSAFGGHTNTAIETT